MKKWIALLLSLVCCLSLAACGTEAQPSAQKPERDAAVQNTIDTCGGVDAMQGAFSTVWQEQDDASGVEPTPPGLTGTVVQDKKLLDKWDYAEHDWRKDTAGRIQVAWMQAGQAAPVYMQVIDVKNGETYGETVLHTGEYKTTMALLSVCREKVYVDDNGYIWGANQNEENELVKETTLKMDSAATGFELTWNSGAGYAEMQADAAGDLIWLTEIGNEANAPGCFAFDKSSGQLYRYSAMLFLFSGTK